MNERPPACFMHLQRYATRHVTWSHGIGKVNLCDECKDAVADLVETIEPLPEPMEPRR